MKNFPTFLFLLAAIALGCWWNSAPPTPGSAEALRLDLERSLTQLWGTTGHEVRIIPTQAGLSWVATVDQPAESSLRQCTWNEPFLKFVARRHTDVRVVDWKVRLGPSKSFIPFPDYFGFDIGPTVKLVERQSRLAFRQIVGDGLILADCWPTSKFYSGPQLALLDHPDYEPIVISRRICAVVMHPAPESTWQKLRQSLALKSYDKFRVVVLHKP